MSIDESRWQRRIERERNARKEAERLLEHKSAELYEANQQLRSLAATLESQVVERTRELQTALTKAEAATLAKNSFLATMSHEIRTPMNAVIGLTSLLHNTSLDPLQKRYLDIIGTNSDHLLALLNDILDFSKIEAGVIDLEQRPFNLITLVNSVCTLKESQAKESSLQLICDVASNTPEWLLGDEMRLRQVLINLVSNAIKFTKQGSVTLRVGIADPRTSLLYAEVQDTGIGIPQDAMGRLFQPFSQTDASITRRFGGTGLGLAICKRIVNAMHGDISVTSVDGKGSCFRIEWPAATCDAPDVAQPVSHTQHDTTFEIVPLCILLAEDNEVNQLVAMAMLKNAGYSADLASDGEEAVSMASHKAYDLILMDMQMPHLDGVSATRKIRSLSLARQPHIVAMTANAFREDRDSCLAAGMNDFLSKPIRLDQLIALLNEVGQLYRDVSAAHQA